jgi:hypothetical protein
MPCAKKTQDPKLPEIIPRANPRMKNKQTVEAQAS